MIGQLKKFLSKILVAILAICLIVPAFATESNLPMADVGEFGTWATENNHERFVEKMTTDVNYFTQQQQIVPDFVPVEAKIGLAFMNAFSFVAHVLDTSLVRFVILFIIIAYAFWIGFEAYTIIIGKSKPEDKIKEIVKKGVMVALWTGVLMIGPAKTFMMVMSPILLIGTAISDAILNAITQTAGINLPDTCGAIREYAANHTLPENLLSPEHAADIMCVPTRLAGFCYTAVALGWKWIGLSIGNSVFGFACGVTLIICFIMLSWRFAFIAFGVIADLFLGIIMLPFTALAETIGKTSYKGIAGDIFNGFMGIFKAESLQSQISRFINAALHFIVLSVVIAICAALLGGIVDFGAVDELPDFNSPGFFVTILVVAITMYLAKNAMKFATDLGGAIDTKMGDTLKSDIKTLWKKTQETAKSWAKVIGSK